MIIDLDNTHRIKGTKRCWQTEKKIIVKGEPVWKPEGYFSNMESAAHSALQREIRTDSARGVIEAIAAIERLVSKYTKIFEGVKT